MGVNKNKNLYLIRHGQTEFNKLKIVQGSGVDSSLNEVGVSQAKHFHSAYRRIPFGKIFISNLKRTFETAKPFIDMKIPFKKMEELNEISWGIYEGKPSSKEMHKAYHKLNKNWDAGNFEERMEGGESAQEMKDRLLVAIDSIKTEQVDDLLVVCHGRAMRCLVCLLKNESIKNMSKVDHFNTGLYKFRFENDAFNLLVQNDTSHLVKN